LLTRGLLAVAASVSNEMGVPTGRGEKRSQGLDIVNLVIVGVTYILMSVDLFRNTQ
jgi:hypothetical protein